MNTRFSVVLSALLASAGCAFGQGVMVGPSAYQCLSDSPFAPVRNQMVYFYLETFEGGELSTPGASGNGTVLGPGAQTDSVDCDDGVVDGSGNGGHSYFRSIGAPGGIGIGFDAAVLGQLPTHVGIVWTDGATLNNIIFQAFDADNVLIGQLTLVGQGDGAQTGGTAEDRFFGVTNPGGVSSIRITSTPAVGANGSGIEIDHLQYGAMPSCVADFNGDGNRNADDLSDYITEYFAVPPGPRADFNGDGNRNADDLSDFITVYFEGC